MLEFNLASEKVILFSARAHQVKTLVDDFILELKKVRVLLRMSPPRGPGAENRALLCCGHTGHACLGSMAARGWGGSTDCCHLSGLCRGRASLPPGTLLPLLPAPSKAPHHGCHSTSPKLQGECPSASHSLPAS